MGLPVISENTILGFKYRGEELLGQYLLVKHSTMETPEHV